MASLNPINLAKNVAWRVAFALRETGQALERTGCALQGIQSYEEVLCRHQPVAPVQYDAPSVKGAWVAPSALVLGDVTIGASSSVWYNASVRGDKQPVTIGQNVNIQDSAIVGGTSEFSPPVVIGDNVSIAHGAILRGCKIGSNSLVGIGAIVSEGAEVSPFSIIAAGSYVEEDAVVPPGEVWAGNPAKKLRELKPAEREYLKTLPGHYVERSKEHAEIMDLLQKKMQDYSR